MIAAVAGSTNTGSVETSSGLADLAGREDLWLHVDAAYGGAVRLSRARPDRVPGLERADTITLDPHKWFFQALRHRRLAGAPSATTCSRRSIARRSTTAATRPQDEPLDWYQYSLEGTRRFRALKLWSPGSRWAREGFGRLVEANLAWRQHLAARCREADDFEAQPSEAGAVGRLLPPPARRARQRQPTWTRPSSTATRTDSSARWRSRARAGSRRRALRGSTWLRAGVVNYLSTEDDVDGLLASLRRLAADPAALDGTRTIEHS